MPIFFYIDPEFAVDPKMRKTDHLTLSYTFFKVEEEEEEEDGDQHSDQLGTVKKTPNASVKEVV